MLTTIKGILTARLAAVAEYLKENESKLIEGLSEIVAQPSVSSTGEGVSKCCELIVKKMKAIGMDVQTYPIEPHSVIIGKIGADPSKKDSFDICSL